MRPVAVFAVVVAGVAAVGATASPRASMVPLPSRASFYTVEASGNRLLLSGSDTTGNGCDWLVAAPGGSETRYGASSMSGRRELSTGRLLLRRWREADREPFAAMNADRDVMEYFPARLEPAASDQLIARIEAGFDQLGYGLWALELRATGEFLGFTGLAPASVEAHFTPAVEVGWRLARRAWGQGYATEAASAALAFGFGDSGLSEIVSFTSAANVCSRAVMERIGMTHDPADDFDHPGLPAEHHLRRHVLYRLSADDWAR
jgi:RimJ/RimL family protein N-acetyltransferase